MKILVVNYEFPPIGGGGSKVSFELARHLVQRGHRVDVLTARYGDLAATEEIDGVRVHRVWSWRQSIHECGLRGAVTFLLSALPRLRRLLKQNTYDLVHYYFALPTGLLSFYSGRIVGLPYIVSLRGSDVPLYDRDSPRLRSLHRLLAPLNRSIWKNAAQVTAVSHGLRELAERSFPDIDIEVIYNGVEITEAGDRTAPSDAVDILRLNCVARLIPRKGIGRLITAVSTIPHDNLQLHIVGTGPAKDQLQELAQERGVDHLTHFHGYQSPEAVAALNATADIFVLPTYSEAFANVILEAMAAELPVIATRVGGIPEAVVDGVTGLLVEPRDDRALAAAIDRLAMDASLRQAMGRAGLERVRRDFSWDVITDAFEQMLMNSVPAAPASPDET